MPLLKQLSSFPCHKDFQRAVRYIYKTHSLQNSFKDDLKRNFLHLKKNIKKPAKKLKPKNTKNFVVTNHNMKVFIKNSYFVSHPLPPQPPSGCEQLEMV